MDLAAQDESRDRRTPRRGLVLVVAVAVVASVAAAERTWGATEPRPRGDVRCLPSRAAVTPTTVVPGATVRVSAPPFTCPASYEPGTTYRVTLQVAAYGALTGENRDLGTVPVGTDGAFDQLVTLPADLPAGEAMVFLGGSAYDLPCQDTEGSAGSCSGYSAYPYLTITPPS